MKKALIAGAASVALAAMPVVGVFATDTLTPNAHTDILSINIDKVCAFGYDNDDAATGSTIEVTGVARTNGGGTWSAATSDSDGNTTATLSKTMLNGTQDLTLGTTKLGVYCNNVNGYQIVSSFVNDDGTASTHSGALYATTGTIPVSASIANASTSAWSYKINSTPASGQDANIGVLGDGVTADTWLGTATTLVTAPSAAPKMTTNLGDYFTITYGVKIDQTQPAGTYTGGIKYTLSQLNS